LETKKGYFSHLELILEDLFPEKDKRPASGSKDDIEAPKKWAGKREESFVGRRLKSESAPKDFEGRQY